MYQIFRELEIALLDFPGVILIVPGLILVFLGLYLWFAGLRNSRLVPMVLAALIAWPIASSLTSSIGIRAVSVTGSALIGLILAKRLLAMFSALIVFLALLIAFSWPMPQYIPSEEPANISDSYVEQSLTIPDALNNASIAFSDFNSVIIEVAKSIDSEIYFKSLAGVLLTLILYVLSDKLILALACSGLGAIFILAGMLLLLIFKGSEPISHVLVNINQYLMIMCGIILLGTVLQFAFWRTPKGGNDSENGDNK